MRLKSIKLAGFKSFVDPTTVSFKSNMTGIVGPNGCGKSNVIDAVRWVMGESSAKYLRGESMTDVIFNGSRHRKPVGQASIELIFDNAQGKLGGAYAQYSEISVKRVVTRDAQSNYLLNGSKCRRRDITDLFLGTGLGARSYAIIEQGMISRLIEARPEELRVYLEEAAGISKYKERRRETENRIRRTLENLSRLEDVREELGKQLERLGRQAEAARRFQTLKARERSLKAELAVLRWKEADHRLAGLLEQLAELETALEACLVKVRQGEARLESARERQAQASDALENAQRQLNETGREIARLEQGLSHRLQRERQVKQEMQALGQQQQQTQQACLRDQEQLAIWAEQLEALTPELAEQAEAEAALQQQLEALEARRHELQAHWETYHRQQSSAQQAMTLAQARIQQYEHQSQRLAEKKQQLSAQLNAIKADDHQDERLEELQLQLESCEEDLLAEEEQLAQLETHKAQAAQQRQSLNDQQRQLSSRLYQAQGRLASLQALQQHELSQEDSRLDAWLSDQGLDTWPWLSEQINIQPGWEKAVEMALGQWLSARTTDAPLAALPAQAWQSLPCGDLLLWTSSASPQLPKADRPSLLERIENPECLPASLQQRLSRIGTQADLASALAQVDALAADECWITPQGEEVYPDGLRLVSSAAAETGVLARQQVIRELEATIAALEAEVEDLEAQLQQIQDQEAARTSQMQQITARCQTLRQQQMQWAAQVAAEQTQHQHERLQRQQWRDELQRIDAEDSETQTQLAMAREALELAQEQLESHQGDGLKHDEERQQLQSQLEQQRQAHRLQLDALQQLRIKQQQLQSSHQAVSQALQRLQIQLEQFEQRQQQLEDELEDLLTPVEGSQDDLNEWLQKHRDQEAEVQTLRQTQQLALQEQRDWEQSRQALDKEVQGLRAQMEDLRLQQQTLMVKRDGHLEQLKELSVSFKAVVENLPEQAIESRWQAELEDTQERIRRLGAINLAAIEEYDQQAERKNYLDAQHAELDDALNTLEQAIRRIDRETKQRFKATFEQVNSGLQALFPRVFGGGTAWLQLTGDDLLETGVAIMARPPGKKNSTIHLLSGGEKALTALALVFSIFELNPAPFCMLDEVDAPLDDANVGRYARLVREMSANIQFIYITHNKQAMESADQLMGVTMQEPGVSRLVSVDLEEAAALVES